VVAWDPVTTSHPTIGRSGPVTISSYELIVESDNGDMTVELPPNVTEFEIPEELLELATEFKVEIIARTTTGNNTAVETCFVTE
jgi:predicted nucleotidyltransferase